MVSVDLRSLTQPVGIMRMVAAAVTLACFGLAAAAGHVVSPYWAWCMFTWFFCFFFTLLILVLEFTTVSAKLPFAWEDFAAAFAMLAALMCLSTAVIYPAFFTCGTCDLQIGASALAWLCVAAYVGEVVLTRLRPRGEVIGFLSTLPGVMKMLETFLACLVFMSLEAGQYSASAELQWCVAVFSLCFVFAILIILLTMAGLASFFPFPFDKMVVVYNVLASVMYATAMVMWPLYSFRNNVRPADCGRLCAWDKLVVISFMSVCTFVVYVADAAYSVWLVFFVSNQ